MSLVLLGFVDLFLLPGCYCDCVFFVIWVDGVLLVVNYGLVCLG